MAGLAEYDFRKNVAYPPEIFMVAKAVDLQTGTNTIADYYKMDPYMLVLKGISAETNDNLSLTVLADDNARALYLPSMGAIRGINNVDDELKIPAFNHLKITIYNGTGGAVSGYGFRHKILVTKPNIASKIYYGITLTPEEEALAEKYGVRDLLQIQPPNQFNPWFDAQYVKIATSVLSSSGTALDIRVPDGRKVVLLDLTAERPASSGSATIYVERDHREEVLEIDPYCLPGLGYNTSRPENSLRIVALDNLRITLEVSVAGTYRIRAVYSESPLTVVDKVRWGLDLKAEERRIAEEQNIEEKIRVGVI